MSAGRNTTVRDRHRAAIRRTKPPCALQITDGCKAVGGVIDYSARYPDPRSFTVDHIVALNRGGSDDLENKQAACNACNREKWDRLPGDFVPRTFVTDRRW